MQGLNIDFENIWKIINFYESSESEFAETYLSDNGVKKASIPLKTNDAIQYLEKHGQTDLIIYNILKLKRDLENIQKEQLQIDGKQ